MLVIVLSVRLCKYVLQRGRMRFCFWGVCEIVECLGNEQSGKNDDRDVQEVVLRMYGFGFEENCLSQIYRFENCVCYCDF